MCPWPVSVSWEKALRLSPHLSSVSLNIGLMWCHKGHGYLRENSPRSVKTSPEEKFLAGGYKQRDKCAFFHFLFFFYNELCNAAPLEFKMKNEHLAIWWYDMGPLKKKKKKTIRL